LHTKSANQCLQVVYTTIAFGSRKRYVRMEGASFGDETALRSCGDDALLELVEFGCDADTSKENAGPIKEIQTVESNGDPGQMDFA
jgi:hypothetical protein